MVEYALGVGCMQCQTMAHLLLVTYWENAPGFIKMVGSSHTEIGFHLLEKKLFLVAPKMFQQLFG